MLAKKKKNETNNINSDTTKTTIQYNNNNIEQMKKIHVDPRQKEEGVAHERGDDERESRVWNSGIQHDFVLCTGTTQCTMVYIICRKKGGTV